MSSPRFPAALAAGKLCAAACKAFFPKRGSNMPGAIALRLDPLFLRHVKGIDPAKTVFVTGTNGKSTANNMIAHVLDTAGRSVCSNIEGANMKPGVATALLKHAGAGGRFKAEYLVLEIDERSLASIADDLRPGILCVTNIQKDQVQRNGDPDYIYQKIKAVTNRANGVTLCVNNDEPRSKSLAAFAAQAVDAEGTEGAAATDDKEGIGKEGTAGTKGVRAVSFGVAQNARASKVEEDWGVTMPCPLCHDALVFSHYNLAGVGAFHCPACGFSSDAQPDTQVIDVDFESESFRICGKDGRYGDMAFRLAYPAAFFLYNYSLCACVCAELGIDATALRQAFETFTNIGGRMESFSHAGKTVRYMRIKQENPETLQSALDTMAEDRKEKVFACGPAVVDDIIPHYSNTFYTFDCNFAPLIESGVERCICFGRTISWDMANRLRYAGFPDEKIEVLDTDDDEKILAAIAATKSDNIYLITWIKKYEKLKRRAG